MTAAGPPMGRPAIVAAHPRVGRSAEGRLSGVRPQAASGEHPREPGRHAPIGRDPRAGEDQQESHDRTGSRAIVITYVAPVVALALGVAVLDERPGPGAIVGLLLILAGSWISTDGRMPPGLAGMLARRRLRTDP